MRPSFLMTDPYCILGGHKGARQICLAPSFLMSPIAFWPPCGACGGAKGARQICLAHPFYQEAMGSWLNVIILQQSELLPFF